jgi:predicted nuclease of predicted toxin-antitoxin system
MPWKPIYTPTDDEVSEFKKQYSGKARILVDENAGPEVARFLEGSFNAKYVGDLGLVGKSDEEVFAAAWREKRVIVTHDTDFLNDRIFPPHRNPGVIRIAAGADGRNDEGLRRSLTIALMIAGNIGSWWIGTKIDFTSPENFTIHDGYSKRKMRWLAHQPVEEWVEDES